MTDIVDRATRSRMMSSIRGVDTGPEKAVRRFLFKRGIRFRLNDRRLPGRPDIVLRKYSAVVQVYGCFWHRHPKCPSAYVPKSNKAFWAKKFRENTQRDRRTERALRKLGWRVFRVWECQVTPALLTALAHQLVSATSQRNAK